MKQTLLLVLLGGLVSVLPAQGDPDGAGGGRDEALRELNSLRQELADLRAKERQLSQRIAELSERLGDRRRARGRWMAPEFPNGRGDLGAWQRRMHEQMRDWQKRMNEQFRGMPKLPEFPRGFGGSGHSDGRSVRIESGPDGVKAEVRERGEDGEWKTETYEAESMEELRRLHPDVFAGGGSSWGFDFDLGAPTLPRRLTPPADRSGPPVPGRPMLGVRVSSGDEEDGLLVQEVVADSLATRLGVKKGDVILEINGEVIVEVEDVAAALEHDGETVQVKVMRDGVEKMLATKAPKARRSRRTKDL